jgi:hypothetical protein
VEGLIGMMVSDRDLWALTLKVERDHGDHGDDAPQYIAERIGAAAAQGDQTGIDLWKAVATRLDQLRQKPAGW